MAPVEHPDINAYRKQEGQSLPESVSNSRVRELVLAAGADDVGIIELGRESIAHCQKDLLDVMPGARSIIVMAFRANPGSLRSLAQSVTDYEFKQVWADVGHAGRTVANRLNREGIRAVNMPAGFPQEASRWPGKIWLTEDKRMAWEAGLGQMGYNRLVIHPEFGAGVLFGSVLMSARCDVYNRPVAYNPCIRCGLCLKVCPTGAVKSGDDFDFLACFTHNYRERLGGFQNWVEQVVAADDVHDYRRRVSDRETVSMWQHLAVGAQNKCDRCMAVCPAGKDLIGEFLDDRQAYIDTYVTRFRELPETVYAVKDSSADRHVKKHFPAKQVKHVSNGLRPVSAEGFLESLPLVFQPHLADGLDAVFHFSFTGSETLDGTVTIQKGGITVTSGLTGVPDLHLTADSQAWIRFLSGETGLLKALLTRKIRFKGRAALMKAFARCFPS